MLRWFPLFSCDFAVWLESHCYQTGKSRAAIAGAEQKSLSEVSYFSVWLLLLGSVHNLHPGVGADGTRPSPSVKDVVKHLDGKDKEDQEWQKLRVCEVLGGWLHCPRPHRNLEQAGEPAAPACGRCVLISVPLPWEAAKAMIWGLLAVTKESLHGGIIFHQLPGECIHNWLGREKKWPFVVYDILQNILHKAGGIRISSKKWSNWKTPCNGHHQDAFDT